MDRSFFDLKPLRFSPHCRDFRPRFAAWLVHVRFTHFAGFESPRSLR